MDSILQSLENSPSYNLYQENSSIAPFVYSIPDALVGCSKNKYSIACPSSADLGKKVRFDLLRTSGIVTGLILKLRLKCVCSTADEDGATGGAWNALESVKWCWQQQTWKACNLLVIINFMAKWPGGRELSLNLYYYLIIEIF